MDRKEGRQEGRKEEREGEKETLYSHGRSQGRAGLLETGSLQQLADEHVFL